MKTIVFLCMLLMTFCVKAEINVENFDDYVRDAKRKESTSHSPVSNDYDSIAANQAQNEKANAAATIFLLLSWALIMHIINIKYLKPYKTAPPNDEPFCIYGMTPTDVSSIVNMNEFSIYDIISVIFDLIQKEALVTDSLLDDEIKIRAGKKTDGLKGYEDFLINWFVGKIGKGEYFSFKQLKLYTEFNSGAMDFSIDLDIWCDEIRDCASIKVVDDVSRKWGFYASAIGIFYGLLGILVMYITGGFYSAVLIGVTFLSFKISDRQVRRTFEAETRYAQIMRYLKDREQVNAETWSGKTGGTEAAGTEASNMPDKFLLYSIPIYKPESIMNQCPTYGHLYLEARNALLLAWERSIEAGVV